jgi:hypothetical protein
VVVVAAVAVVVALLCVLVSAVLRLLCSQTAWVLGVAVVEWMNADDGDA